MTEPTSTQTIREAMNDRLDEVHTVIPATVVSVDTSAMTITAQPLIKMRVLTRAGGYRYETRPPIHNVPLAFPQGGNTFIRWTVSAGDPVELRFSEVDFGQYKQTGKIAEPGDDTRHGMNGAIATPSFLGNGGGSVPTGGELVLEGDTIRAGEGATQNVILSNWMITELAAIAAGTLPNPSGAYVPSVPPTTKLKAE